jgi:hypothetical protein
MRKAAAVLALIACGATAASSSAGGSGKASLRLVDRDPLTVRGYGFKPRERVRVTASVPESRMLVSGPQPLSRVIRASATGSFRVVFSDIPFDRCTWVRVAAIGGQGSRAMLKVLPSPMCAPSLSP